MNLLRSYLLLDDPPNTNNQIANWRISALRIIVCSGMLLCLAVALHIFSKAMSLNLIYAIVLSVGFFILMFILVIASKRYYVVCSHSLLVTIVLASVFMNLYLTDLELAKVGSMYMYSCPIIALMLVGYKSALFYAVLNIIPFYMIINNIDLSSITDINQQLPSASIYITGLIFLFFNICIPLAVARTIVAAKRLNKKTIQSNEYLNQKQILYRTFFSQSPKAKIIADKNGLITDCNEQALLLFSITKVPENLATLLNTDLPLQTLQSDQIIKYKNQFLRVSHYFFTDSQLSVYDFSDCTHEEHIKQNLTAMEQENKRLRYCDNHTQLPNRDWFELQCEKLITKYRKHFYVVVMQSANNDYLNLTLSQEKTKHLLRKVYKRLKETTQAPILCAHIGEAQIAFIVTSHSKTDLHNTHLPAIKAQLDTDYLIYGESISQLFLLGYACYPENGKSLKATLNNAIGALKLANVHTHPINQYDEQHSQAFIEKHEISMLLDEALTNADIDVVYQPKVNAAGKCIGFEALARWQCKVLGVVSPGVFVPIAEEYQMISRLTELIIQKVCAQIATWSKQGSPVMPVAINISLIDFSQSDFMSKLVKYLADFNVNPSQIELELTETALESQQTHSLALIKTLQSWGFIISVDDFGVGYSNISRLADYPINKLKLDRSLISQVTNSSRQQSLVKAIHVMCEALNVTCVAEGVETKEQVKIMHQMGCKEFQGFYFSKPITVEQLDKHTAKHGLYFNSRKKQRME
ncbi:EAL domain-containing protein [Pseudoalteromonas sp. MMG010]|uniref:putative bifunctional diguanylate cyclase/phosphodiesterase n=1 Tax=Pseudoalteromonas sp. MMG010 TaxID=2822685 RepID=UPI001B3A4C23|nr:GGDEF domain-containing phosphodiesterase [Pseudoalteromonas sp. MMG010]MBQ4832212.1 EAL domain-containing protein [Pseudoalteromonas sp. MMG010]